MLGKDALSRLALGAAALVAAAGLVTGTAQAGQHPAPAPKADPYIEINDVVTNVGQRPHLVVTYGNSGGRTLHYVHYRCWIVSGDSVRHPKLNYNTYRSPLLPGQSANFELEGKAVKTGKTKVQCSIIGFEKESQKERFAISRVATIRVNP